MLLAILPQITRLLDAKLDKLNFKELRMGMKQFQNILKNFWEIPEFLPVGTCSAILDFLTLVTQTVKKDKEERLKQLPKSRSKMDTEDLEAFFEDLEKVDKVAKFAMEVSAVLMKNVRDASFQSKVMTSLGPIFGKVLLNLDDSKDYEVLSSVCFVCDCIEHGIPEVKNPIMG